MNVDEACEAANNQDGGKDEDLPAADIPLPKFAAPQSGAGGVPPRQETRPLDGATAPKRWSSRAQTSARTAPGEGAGDREQPLAGKMPAPSPSPQLPPGVQLHCREAPFVRGDGVLIF